MWRRVVWSNIKYVAEKTVVSIVALPYEFFLFYQRKLTAFSDLITNVTVGWCDREGEIIAIYCEQRTKYTAWAERVGISSTVLGVYM
jgi:hypothetical protein